MSAIRHFYIHSISSAFAVISDCAILDVSIRLRVINLSIFIPIICNFSQYKSKLKFLDTILYRKKTRFKEKSCFI